MRRLISKVVITATALVAVAALAVGPSIAPAAAAPAPGAIPLAFLRNQVQYCTIICPFAVQGAVTVPLAVVQAPATFVGALQTSTPLQAVGQTAASVTGPARAAAEPIIGNDLSLVLPKAQNALQVAVVQGIDVALATTQPADLGQAIDTARTAILAALDQPVGAPVGPTGARNLAQVAAVEAINVGSAIAFQAGEMLLLGAVQTADVTATTLARSGDPGAALTAGAAQAISVTTAAVNTVSAAVDTARTNVVKAAHPPKATQSDFGVPSRAQRTDPRRNR